MCASTEYNKELSLYTLILPYSPKYKFSFESSANPSYEVTAVPEPINDIEMSITKKIINNENIEKSDKRFIFFHHPILLCCFTILFPIPADKIALGVDDEVLDVRHNARDAQASSVLELVDSELRHIDNIEIYGSDNAVHHLI